MTYMLALLLFHVVSAYCFGCHFRISRHLCRLPDPTWRPLVVRNLSNPSVLAVDEQHRRCGPRGCDTFFLKCAIIPFFLAVHFSTQQKDGLWLRELLSVCCRLFVADQTTNKIWWYQLQVVALDLFLTSQ